MIGQVRMETLVQRLPCTMGLADAVPLSNPPNIAFPVHVLWQHSGSSMLPLITFGLFQGDPPMRVSVSLPDVQLGRSVSIQDTHPRWS